MATLKDEIYAILLTDAQSAVAGSLGVLLGYNAVTKPRCVYFTNAPDPPGLPRLSYHIITQSRWFPRTIYYGFTCWAKYDWEEVLARVFELLHKSRGFTATDYSTKALLFDGSGPDLWDPNLKCYYRQDRYMCLAVRTPLPV